MAETAVIVAGISAAATVAGTAVAVSSANAQAKAASQAAQLEMNQYAAERKAAQDQANQQIAQTMREQEKAKAALVARRAALGLDPFSTTGRALLAETDEEVAADLESIRANSGRVIGRLSAGEMASGLRARSAIDQASSQATGAMIGAVGSLANTGYRYMSPSVGRNSR